MKNLVPAEQEQQWFLWQAPAVFRFDLGLFFCGFSWLHPSPNTSNSLHLLSLPLHLSSSPLSHLHNSMSLIQINSSCPGRNLTYNNSFCASYFLKTPSSSPKILWHGFLSRAFVLHKNVLSFMKGVQIQLKRSGGKKTDNPPRKNTIPLEILWFQSLPVYTGTCQVSLIQLY